MKHTPFGYSIVDGKLLINEKEADAVRSMFAAYLNGASLIKAAEKTGRKMGHCQAKNILQNQRYIGNDDYPPIIERKTFDAAAEELKRREKQMGRDKLKKKPLPRAVIHSHFSILPIHQKYTNPIRQAEYAYEQIQEVAE